ncbi:hypothetical protein Dvina_37345 [Dactylosporangium vinaceum]|uniref:Uncharacterized protein n=1 Tax=Dactylosporangium vinaceum TaxID=53362 RepID=A0ABV5MQR9_9ACTN|nr:hypothetical protein [Dactylosporangium vinaceum]UAB93832.1 hypothetical protein Dvina_37345 [Dactylosporangium vinaceum]
MLLPRAADMAQAGRGAKLIWPTALQEAASDATMPVCVGKARQYQAA